MKYITSLLLAACCGGGPVLAALPVPTASTPGATSPRSISAPLDMPVKRAASASIDLRMLPADQPRIPEYTNRQSPRAAAIELPGSKPLSTAAVLAPSAPSPSPTANFAGLDFASWGDGYPPNANADVGPTYIIEAVNSSIGIYLKASGARVAAFTFDAFMSQGNFGNLCDSSNRGNPVVLYDTFEDRWIISDLAYQTDMSGVVQAPGSYQCIAVSRGGDPLAGGWNFYSINSANALADDPKLGVWPDGIYLSVNRYNLARTAFQNVRLTALNKAQMYAGAASVQSVAIDAPAAEFTLLPANARLQAGTPPAGSPNYFAVVWLNSNAISIYKFHVDWNSVSTSTLTGPFTSQTVVSWTPLTNGVAKSPTVDLDTLHPRLMVQNQYSNIGGTESVWDVHTVGASGSSSSQAALRYYQVNVTGGSVGAFPTQGVTFSPETATNRFMPSVAVDRAGNMAMSYSASSQTLAPAIRYAGRLATDPLGTIPQAEASLIEGGGSQLVNCGGVPCTRWGGYGSMTLDPDGCRFWMVNEYYAADGGDWQTRIGAFKYPAPACVPVASGSVQGVITASAGGAPIIGATVALGSRTTSTNGNGAFAFAAVPSGTYPSISAAADGYNSASSANVGVSDGNTTVRNLALAAAASSACQTDTTQADLQTGIPTNVDLAATPGDAVLARIVGPDQHADDNAFGSGYAFNSTSFQAQTFTAGYTGGLFKVDAWILCGITCSGSNPNMIMELRTTSAGLPVMTAGGLLATATIAGSSSGVAAPYTFAFAGGSPLTVGVQYGLVLKLAANRTVGNNAWLSSNGDVYAGGQRLTCTASACSVPGGGNANSDLVFKTYMQTGYYPSGDIVSSVKDANPAHDSIANWTTLSLSATTPANTQLRMQVAASNSAFGPFNYVGPDGTAATYYTVSGGSLSQFNGSRYLRYRAYLDSSASAATPALNDVTVCHQSVAGPPADLSVSNDDGVTTAVPGAMVTYSITAANAGPSAATNATVVDSFPAGLSCTWTCAGTNAGTCAAAGSGDIFGSVDLPNGASVMFTATCAIAATATGTLANSASVIGPQGVSDPSAGNNSATDTDTLTPQANLGIGNDDGVITAIPGGSVSYVITASNAGPSAAPGSTVTDTFPAALNCSWTCAGSAGGSCTAAGNGNIGDSVNLPVGASVVYSVGCTISPSASGSLANTASIAPSGGVTDTVPGNNSATDTDTLVIHADVGVTISDHRAFVRVGDVVDYVIEVTNPGGPSNAAASVSDVLPAELTAGSWTCVGSGGAGCAGGSGNALSDTATLPVGGKAAYLYSAQVLTAGAADQIVNMATASLQSGVDGVPGNDSANDSDTVVLFRDDFEGAGSSAVALPAADYVTRMVADPQLLAGLGIVPVEVASGRSADGRLLFSVQIARFGRVVAARVTTTNSSRASATSVWHTLEVRDPVVEFAWQSLASDGSDGYLGLAAGGVPLLQERRSIADRLASLLIPAHAGKPLLAPSQP